MKTKEQQMTLRDPHAYNTAAEMLTCSEVYPYTEEADSILNLISGHINTGMLIENEKIWTLLKALEPYRMTEQVQTAVNTWVDKMLENIADKQKDKNIPPGHLRSMSVAYKEKDFEKTVNIACNILLDIPNTLDTRNNLALALMHLNYDLCAQLELEIIRRMSDHYTPGLINLTVLNERMNRSIHAKEIAMELLSFSRENFPDVPLIRYNAAWYLNDEGDYREADLILNKIREPAYNKIEKYAGLKATNKKQLKEAGKKR